MAGIAGGVGGALFLVIIVLVIVVCVLVCQVRRRGHIKFVSGELKVNSLAFNLLHVAVLYKTTPLNSNVLRAPSDHYPALVIAWFRVLLYLETAHKFSEAWHQELINCV